MLACFGAGSRGELGARLRVTRPYGVPGARRAADDGWLHHSEGASAQEAYIERLAEVGLSGLLVAEQMYAPELSSGLTSAADRLSLPVLLTAYSVPFTAIARTVAEANRDAEHQRLLQAVRVYETARLAVGSGSDLMAQLGDVTGCDLFVLDSERGHPLLAKAPPAPEGVGEALIEEMARRSDPMPAILRLRTGTSPAIALFVPASRPAAMVAVSRTAEPPDLSILRHVATLAALEVEKLTADYERRRRLGAELLAGLIDSRIAADSATHLLAERGLTEEPRLLACCSGDSGANEHSNLHLRLEDRGILHLLLRRTPVLTALLPGTTEAIDAFREEIDPAFPVGLSDPIGTVSRVPDAYREAMWALQGARAPASPSPSTARMRPSRRSYPAASASRAASSSTSSDPSSTTTRRRSRLATRRLAEGVPLGEPLPGNARPPISTCTNRPSSTGCVASKN